MDSSMILHTPEIESDRSHERDGVHPIFALDIGTRSVVGTVGYQRENLFEVTDFEQVFHKVHAMRDGQIEDIELVASAVRQVKTALETRGGVKFTRTAIAAAGRTLMTVSASYSTELDENEELTPSFIHSLEYAVINAAQQKFLEENPQNEAGDFFCVGYSVTSYTLDGYAFTNLEGHRGKNVSLEAIAAFLPSHVVFCLNAVTERNGLEIENLTLEPIAAINVIVPRDIRLLNIVIVDIGAGTSDIAISRNGSIAAYGMVTIAGDEISEMIMRTFLTDFDTAEKIKLDWANGIEEIAFSDILGLPRTLPAQEVERVCEPVIDTLCKTVSESILSINGGAPMAVFLVGGGSGTPGLCPRIADGLGLAPERVAVGGRTPFKNISLCSDLLQSPEFVTPIGIGVVCSLYKGCNFFSITVNDRSVMLLDQGAIKVMDALLLAGIKPSRLIGLSSPGINYTLNGQRVSERGNPPKPGLLTVNGEEGTIHTIIKQGDVIIALPAENGRPLEITAESLTGGLSPLHVVLDGETISIIPAAKINGADVAPGYLICDGDNVTTGLPATLGALLEQIGKKEANTLYSLNGAEASGSTPIGTGDIIRKLGRATSQSSAAQAAVPQVAPTDMTIKVCVNGAWHDIGMRKDEPPQFVDMLNYTDIDPKNPQGELILLINGRPAGYLDPLSDNDQVEIRWETDEGK